MKKGLIVVSSITGNTEKMAHRLASGLSNVATWHVRNLKDHPSAENFDYILVGGWIDRGTLNAPTLNWVKALPKMHLGLFGTLGAMPDSVHGQETLQNLNEILKNHISLGAFLLPGTVDKNLVEKIKKMSPGMIPENIRQQMIEAGENSRVATECEYEEAVSFFLKNFKN